MKTDQVNLRLDAALISELEEIAREEFLERGVVIRKLLVEGLKKYRVERAFRQYQSGEISIGRAAEDTGMSHWDVIDEARRRGIAYPVQVDHIWEMLESMRKEAPRVAEGAAPAYQPSTREQRAHAQGKTLPDYRPQERGVLFIGINPAPVSVDAGHYYQGRIGQRIWRRLERLGLLENAVPGQEDTAFVKAGHGLTDVVKRVTVSADELSAEELEAGAKILREKIKDWRPGLVLFAFKQAAMVTTGKRDFSAGEGPLLEGVPTFLLSSPYVSRSETDENEDLALALLAAHGLGARTPMTQQVTEADLRAGRIRIPLTGSAKELLPKTKQRVQIILRGRKLEVAYNPRVEDKKRSGILSIGREELTRGVNMGERLKIRKADDGSIILQ